MLTLDIGLYRYYSGIYIALGTVVWYHTNFSVGHTDNKWRNTKGMKKVL